MKTLSFRGFPRFLRGSALLGLGALVLASTGACAQVLGIEDTTLSTGPVEDPCLEEIVPYLWYFVNNIREDGTFPLSVIPASSFAGLRAAFGQADDPTKGHVVADARDCRPNAGLRDGGPGDAGGVQFQFRFGPQTLDSNFFIDNSGQPNRDLTETQDIVSLGGLLNAPAEAGTILAIPNDLGGAASSSKSIRAQAGYLTTLRMEPTAGLPVPDGVDPIPERWNCVGNVSQSPASTESFVTITANISDFSTQMAATPGIRFRVCRASDFGCDLLDGETPDAVSDENSVAKIRVPIDANGEWNGYLIVKGKVRKTTAECL
jgi:hypothetical protein